MSIFYISLALSITFTLLVSSLRIIVKFPRLLVYLNYFKKFLIVPKLVIISQIFLYRYLGIFAKKHIIIYNIITYSSILLVILSIFFRYTVITHNYVVLPPLWILLFSLILCLNTIYRSFVSFCLITHNSRLFTFLYLEGFFNEIKEIPYWGNYVIELFVRTKIREDLERDNKI